MKRLKAWHGWAGAALVACAITFFGFEKGESRDFQIAKNLDIFNSVIKELEMFYVDTINPGQTIREGIDNMLYALDPYTVYYPEDDQSELEQMLNNSYGGIGAVITTNAKTGYSIISEPYEGMPAAQAGLKAGDILLELDGTDLKGKKDVNLLLRGQAGTQFALKVRRPGVKKELNFDITRRSIELPILPYYATLGNQTGYINLSTFSGRPSKEFRQAFKELKEQGITSLIIDLRDNGGGLLDEAIEIANLFVPKGRTLVTTRGKMKQASRTYTTLRDPLDLDIPIAVLTSQATASAAEILAGSLQDLDRAVIVGTRTYGKGLVQTTRALPYGGAMKLTTSKYYIPSGRCVQAIDYSHRNEDGSVGRIPDSLTTVFHTAAGREVRDGGGVTPDLVVKHESTPNILYYLANELHIFDFVTQWCIGHPTIAPAGDFSITPADYKQFKDYLKEKNFTYDRQSDRLLKSLKEVAEFEGYKEDAQAEFEALEKKLQHNLERDLEHFEKEISKLIAVEIQKRYYYQKGAIIEQLKDDEDLKTAIDILSDRPRYKELLSASGQTARP